MRVALPFCVFFGASVCFAQKLEEIVMYEVVSIPYDSLSVTANVGGSLGKVHLSLERDNYQDVLSGLSVRFGDIVEVRLGSDALNCIPNPVIEASTFDQTELGDRATVPADWFSSISLPFLVSGQAGMREQDVITIPRYPSIEFQFVGFEFRRIRVRKSSEEVKTIKVTDESCPVNLVNWARGRPG